jgi:hypothetical protein
MRVVEVIEMTSSSHSNVDEDVAVSKCGGCSGGGDDDDDGTIAVVVVVEALTIPCLRALFICGPVPYPSPWQCMLLMMK